jgi:thioredoxin-related protein
MKNILLILALTFAFTACGNKNKTADKDTETQQEISIDKSQTTVIYFHSNHRCATCLAVENITKEALKENYKEAIPFFSIDMTLEENKALMKTYSIGVQTLIVVKKDTRIDLTSEAFMYARSKPEKVKGSLKASIDSLQ